MTPARRRRRWCILNKPQSEGRERKARESFARYHPRAQVSQKLRGRGSGFGPPLLWYVRELGAHLDGHRKPNRQPRTVDHRCNRHRRCALPSAFRTRGTPKYAYGRRMHLQPRKFATAAPRYHGGPAGAGACSAQCSACVMCRLPTREQNPCACAQATGWTTRRMCAAWPLNLTPRAQSLQPKAEWVVERASVPPSAAAAVRTTARRRRLCRRPCAA